MEINQTTIDSLKGNSLLSQWEKDFIESVSDFFSKKGRVSAAQERVLIRCFDKCSPQKQKELDEWAAKYDAEKRKIALLCARYYENLGYFRNLCSAVIKDPDNFMLTEEQWTKMCQNTYAQRVIENSKTPFQFELGDLARVRQTINQSHLTPAVGSEPFWATRIKGQAVIIIDRKDPIEKPEQYKVVRCSLIANSAISFWCEERKLKNFKSKK